jgi:NAD(P)-dependent dehydrogenase (short-subunit alcohol dehydrogenase family)
VSAVRGAIGVTHLAAPPNAVSSFSGIGTANRVGRTRHFEVFYDRVFGETGRFAGAIVLNRAERDLTALRDWFGLSSDSEQFTVVLSRLAEEARAFREDESGSSTTLFCDVQTTPRLEAFQSSFFVVFQLADMFAARVGWDPEIGAALARVLAAALYPRRIAGFATAWLWLEGDRTDFSLDSLGHDSAATGGAVLFLNYLHHQLGFSWHEIVASPASTLGTLATRLTGSNDDFSRFRSMLEEYHPSGQPSALLTDNPFPLVDKHHPVVSPEDITQVSNRQRSIGNTIERRVCLLTGASGTLGRNLHELLVERYEFASVYRSRPVQSDVFAIEADLTKDGECERVVNEVLSRFDRIDLVINAAMVSTWGRMLESEALQNSAPNQFLTNVIVPLRVSCAVARLFWQDHVSENRSKNRSVINISSVSGHNLYPGEGQSVYAASKAALDHLTGHMALEFAEVGVRVNAVAPNSFPGVVPIGRVAQAIEGLDLGKDTGTIVVVDGDADRVIHLIG